MNPVKRLLILSASLCLLWSAAFGQQTSKPDSFFAHVHIPLAAIPTSPAPAIAPVVDPGAGAGQRGSVAPAGVTVTSLWFSNTNASTVVTVTVSCTTSGTAFVTAAIPGVAAGGNNIPVQMPADGLWCAGGVTWQASITGVMGTISARY
jgi:hypothetical protein